MAEPLERGPPAGLAFRPAEQDDLPDIVRLLVDDPLGATREVYSDPPDPAYLSAFRDIDGDQNNELVVAVLEGRVVGVLQLTYIPYLTYRGSWRAQIEGIRVASGLRQRGIGSAMLRWAIERSREHGCVLVQLTTDKTRPGALPFYEQLGFVASHHGMKLKL